MLYVIWIHILAMFGVTGLEVGPDIIMWWVARTREVTTIRSVFRLARPIGNGISALAGVGAVSGLILVHGLNYQYLAFWLVASYFLYAAGGVRNLLILTPWRAKVLAAARTSPDQTPSPELDRLLRDRKAKHAVWINLVIDAAIIFDMVVKPLS